ncbi:MAG TPA: phosphatase PAP2 family protein [Gaiellaceae bacterium]|nr:phosphatase PAP2 family protein [Gaiellaceae bacterium]
MDYRVFRAIDGFSRQHAWLAHGANRVETIGVVLYAVAVVVLWLAADPGGERTFKVAALGGAVSGGLALLANRLIASAWERPRPYEAHPGVYHLTSTHDPSFPSDHASAAFAIAVAILLIAGRVGWIFLAGAAVIAFGRLLIGAHYPGDVLAGAAIGTAVALAVATLGRSAIERAVVLLEPVSDPAAARFHRAVRRRAG